MADEEHPLTGIHAVAAAVMCANGSSRAELDLAEIVLKADVETIPVIDGSRKLPPREIESVAGCWNRHMDAAIDSVNDSVGEATRAGRRARLSRDLDRAGLILMDRDMVAVMIIRIDELKNELAARLPLEQDEDLGAELLDGEPVELVVTVTAASPSLPPDVLALPSGGFTVVGHCNLVDGRGVIEFDGPSCSIVPGGINYELGPDRYDGAYLNPNVND